MTEPTVHELPTVEVDFDVATWLRAPSPLDDESAVRQWQTEVLSLYTSAFELAGSEHRAERSYLKNLFSKIARMPYNGNALFFRFRSPGDTPLPVLLEFFAPFQVEEFRATLGDQRPVDFAAAMLSADDFPAEARANVETVGQGPWQRLCYWTTDAEDQSISATLRYVREFQPSGVVVIVRAAEIAPSMLFEVVADMDLLVKGVSVTAQQ